MVCCVIHVLYIMKLMEISIVFHSGHPAIASIMEYCGHSFWRFRIGIGSPPRYELLGQYVTNPWTLREKQLLYSEVYDC